VETARLIRSLDSFPQFWFSNSVNSRAQLLQNCRRIVLKFGTGLLTHPESGVLDERRIAILAEQIAALRADRKEILIVSSGAIGAGMAELRMKTRPKQLPELQAAAAIGQTRLMSVYQDAFNEHDVRCAQVLLTHDDLKHRQRHLNARNTLLTLLGHGVVPVINENDTVAVDEIRFGDNDTLAALVANLIAADLLVILSHVDGLLDKKGRVVTTVEQITPEIHALAGGTQSATSVGGMISKLQAAEICQKSGIPMLIANGTESHVLQNLMRGDEIGTLFLPKTAKLSSRKRWIAFYHRPKATLVVDEGAAKALRDNGKSLLAKGIVTTRGEFSEGDVVSIEDQNGVEFARGMAEVSHDKLKSASVVVHRDNMVILV
jgi:glutamate 5-kinase